MASSARRIVVEFLGDDKSASKTASSVDKKFGSLGSRLDKVGQASGKILAAGVLAGGAALYKMGQSAAADEEAQAKLATQLRNAAGATDEQIASTEAWITAQGKSKGFSDDQLRPAMQQLVNVTHDVGKAQRLAALAMDVSAGTGKSYESVVASLVKAQNGSVSGLSRLGVATKDAAGNTLSLQQVTKSMADTFQGAAAKAADTTAGKQRIMAIQMQELGEQIGALVLPAMQKLTSILMTLADWVSRHTTLVGALVAVIGTLLAVLWTVSAAMRAWATITKIWTAVTKAAAAVQWLLNAALTANPIGIVVVAIAALAAGLVIAYKRSETFRRIVDGAFQKVRDVAQKVFGWMRSAVSAVIGFVRDHWKLLVAILGGPLGLAVYAIVKNWGRIKDAFRAGWDFVKSVTRAAVEVVKDAFRGGFDVVRSLVSSGVSHILDAFRSIPGKLRGLGRLFLSAGRSLIGAVFDGIRSAVSNAGSFISSFASQMIEAVKNAINSALGLPLDVSFDKGPIHIHATVIPAFAKGGVSRGGLALVGEQGPELVDLPGGARVYSSTRTQQMTGGDFTATAPLIVNIEGRAVVQAILTFKRRNGNVELGIA